MITLTNVSKIRIVPQMGWLPDEPDDKGRDLSLSTSSLLATAKASGMPSEMDLSKYFRPISDQMQFPSCTGNATADMWESILVKNKVKKGLPLDKARNTTPDLSRMFLWYNGRQAMNPPRGRDASSGCYNRLVVDVLARHGVPTETKWPYILKNATKRPSIQAYREAMGYTAKAFYTIKETGNPRLEVLLRTLDKEQSIVFGTALDQSFMEYKAGVLHRPTGDILGRHAMVIVGWSQARQAFKVRNSWTNFWGEDGYCWLHTDYIIDYAETGSFWTGSGE